MCPGAELQPRRGVPKYHEGFQRNRILGGTWRSGERHSGVDLSRAGNLIFRDIGPIKEIRIKNIASVVCLLVFGGTVPSARGAGPSCEPLAQLVLPNAKVISARLVAAGAFTPPTGATPWLVGDPSFYQQVPPFCRVMIEDQPSVDSDIKIEVWLPVARWNGKFRGQANGGFAGEIDYRMLGWAVMQGYASAATDTGHAASGTDASWALGHPEKIVDFAYRGIHEMTVAGKAVVKAFYGETAKHSYFTGCSNGGRQGLMEAQRYPDDYDGIIAGAPANYWTHLVASAIWDMQATTLNPDSYIPAGKIPAIAHGVLAGCDALDAVKDGILNDPRQCYFDPASMSCKGADSDSCLTPVQVTTLKKLYQGAHDSKGKAVFPGFVPGGEEGQGGWSAWITGSEPRKALLFAFGWGYFANMVYEKHDWDYTNANLDDAVAASDKKFANVLNAMDPDMEAFAAHGGKLILYHGWSDPGISPLASINYYESVVRKMGQKDADSFVRLYMVPGMQHCNGGPGADIFGEFDLSPVKNPQHNISMALEEWVEKGTAPSSVTASKIQGQGPTAKVAMTRPLCAYPQKAEYKGNGDPNDAASFVCGN
jgi:Tannase and feruloyl esterase